jgi:hypothetical protein
MSVLRRIWVFRRELASQRQYEFDQIIDLLFRQKVEFVLLDAMLSPNDQVSDRQVATVVHVGSRAPAFEQAGRVELVGSAIVRSIAAHVV